MRCANTKLLCIYIMEGSLLFIHFIVAQTVLGKMDKYTQIVRTALYPKAPIAPLTHRNTHSHEVTSEHKPRALPRDGPGSELFCELHLFFAINL